jgi:hypothetical protein
MTMAVFSDVAPCSLVDINGSDELTASFIKTMSLKYSSRLSRVLA